jgi:hypothetical protein
MKQDTFDKLVRKGERAVAAAGAQIPILRHACMADADRLYPPPGTVLEDCPICAVILRDTAEQGRLRDAIHRASSALRTAAADVHREGNAMLARPLWNIEAGLDAALAPTPSGAEKETQ